MVRAWQLWLSLLLAACVDLSRPPSSQSLDAPVHDGSLDDRPADGTAERPAPDGPEAGPDLDLGDDADGPSSDLPSVDVALANGKICTFDSLCQSGICSDGVCCGARCEGVCQACDLGGSVGICSPVPAGDDPGGDCPQEPAATCARDGSCDGQGGCRLYAAGTECAAGRCIGAAEYAASTCDGRGVCAPGASKSCAPNACREESCASTCASHADCQSGFICEGDVCKLKRGIGMACSAAIQCANGFCVDGVCCASACDGTCVACNLSGSVGSCAPIPAGQDPVTECPAEAPQTCGRAGACNGQGACRLHPDGTTCAAQTCSEWTETGVHRCNGSGACVRPVSRDCDAYLCSGTACGTSCSGTGQCRAGNVCLGSSCVPCYPESNSAFCQRLGKTCGKVTDTDNCGSTRTVSSCGSCPAPQTCGGGGTANVCGGGSPCQPAYKQSDCVGYVMGTRVSNAGRNWSCLDRNCANCATHPGCAPGGSACPWGTVWSDDGPCQ